MIPVREFIYKTENEHFNIEICENYVTYKLKLPYAWSLKKCKCHDNDDNLIDASSVSSDYETENSDTDMASGTLLKQNFQFLDKKELDLKFFT